MPQFQNWSGDVKSQPTQIRKPKSEAEIIAIVKEASQNNMRIRVVGAGHSFMPLVHTHEILLSLDNIVGIKEIDKEHARATVLAGTRIKDLGRLLFQEGLAIANQGDVDAQSLAGAISTGTHGSGISLGSISSQVIGIRMVLANGEVLDCSETEKPDIFKAAQLSMGMLGIITQIRMQLVPAYKLASVSKNIPAEECLSQLPTLQQGNRNFEFYYFPYSPYTQLKMMNPTDDPAEKYGVLNYLSDMVLENYVFQVLSTTSKYIPSLAPAISKLSGALVGSAARKCWSYDAYPTPRLVRFHEMEYNIPIEHFEKVFREVRDCMEKNRFKINFPLECRFVKADDIWLSPCYKRDSAYIAAHAYQGTPFKEYFAALEAIFTQYDGRPHWGKINTADTPYLEKAYPKFHAFLDIRRQLDEKGMFLNDYLKGIFS